MPYRFWGACDDRRRSSQRAFRANLVRRTVLSLSLLSITALGCSRATKPSGPPSGPPEVTVARPLVMPIVEWDPYTGRIEAIESVNVRARVSGYLQEHYFEEGHIVEAGDLLFVIDPRPFEAELAEANAGLLEAKAAVAQARSGVTQQRANRGQVAARVDLAQKRLNRAQRLLPSGAVSQDEFDIFNSELQQATADLEAAAATIQSAEASLAASEAAVETAMANLETAKLNLSYTRITAPITGRISRRLATKGNLISGGTLGSSLLTTIVSLDPIHCYFDANERALLKYTRLDRSGERESSRDAKNPVYMSLVDENGFPHQGHMDFVDNRVDQQTGTIRGRAIFSNADLTLSPGMFAKVRIPGSGRYDAVLIPDEAIGSDQATQFVYVVGDENRVSRRVVATGPIAHGLRVIRKGLESSEQIVISGIQRVREGQQIQPIEKTLTAEDEENDLPNDFEPVPKEQWLTPKVSDEPPPPPESQPAESPVLSEPRQAEAAQ